MDDNRVNLEFARMPRAGEGHEVPNAREAHDALSREALAAGCDGHVSNPFDSRRLPGILAGFLARDRCSPDGATV